VDTPKEHLKMCKSIVKKKVTFLPIILLVAVVFL